MLENKRLGKQLFRYMLSAILGVAADITVELLIPGNGVGEKVLGAVTGITVAKKTNDHLKKEVVFVEVR